MSADEGRSPAVVRKSIEPLAAWYLANKPDVKRLVVSQDDYDRLSGASNSTLSRNKFRKVGDRFYWNDFEIVRK